MNRSTEKTDAGRRTETVRQTNRQGEEQTERDKKTGRNRQTDRQVVGHAERQTEFLEIFIFPGEVALFMKSTERTCLGN